MFITSERNLLSKEGKCVIYIEGTSAANGNTPIFFRINVNKIWALNNGKSEINQRMKEKCETLMKSGER